MPKEKFRKILILKIDIFQSFEYEIRVSGEYNAWTCSMRKKNKKIKKTKKLLKIYIWTVNDSVSDFNAIRITSKTSFAPRHLELFVQP